MKKLICIFVILFTLNANALGPCFPIQTADVAYLPKLKACDNKAAVVLSGKFLSSFSVVTRDCNNNDRDPCYKHLGEDGSCASNYSSPFKAIKKIRARVLVNKVRKTGMIYCFRESGNSQVYRDLVRRITIKRRNPVVSDKDIVRLCLPDRSKATTKVRVNKIMSQQNLGGVGFSAKQCLGQQYLACDTSYCSICDAAATNPICN